MTDVRAELEARLRPLLEQGARDMRATFDRDNIVVRSFPVGERTTLQGHALAVECLLEAPAGEADLVALEIVVRHVTTTPEIEAADVAWGHPSGFVEEALGLRGLPYDEDALRALELGVPTLFEALRRALTRRKPLDE